MRTPDSAFQLLFLGVIAPLFLSTTAEGAFYPTISVTSDYRYNGISYSDGEAVPQLSLYWTVPRHFYVGAWYSEIDFKDPGRTSIELDLYAGREFQIGKYRVSLETLYTTFPDKAFPGPTYDFVQLKSRIRRLLDGWTIGLQTAWTPEASYRSGTATRVAAEMSHDLKPWAILNANIGRRWIDVGDDRTYWEAGISLKRRNIVFDIRYTDTNLNSAQCRLRCDATVTGTLSFNLWR